MEDRVQRILRDVLDIGDREIPPTASFVEDLGADSVDMVELVQRFEKEFQITIRDSDAANLKTVQLALNFIAEQTAQRC